MTDTTDGRRRRGFALALLVALTALFLAPAVAFAPAASAAYSTVATFTTGGTTYQAERDSDGTTWRFTISGTATPNEEMRQEVLCGDGQWSTSWATFGSASARAESGGPYVITGRTTTLINGLCTGNGHPAPATYHSRWRNWWTDAIVFEYDHVVADTTAPTAPTVTIVADGADVTATWTGSTDAVGVTGYRYRWDGSSIWVTWSAVVPFSALDKTVPHTIEVQARDAAGNWSGTGTDSWGGCTSTSTDGCSGWGTGGEGDWGAGEEGGDCPFVNSSAHCLDWSTDRPELADPAPNRWTFGVKDKGFAIATSATYIVGWTCSGQDPVEGWASWHAMQDRRFDVDCAEGESVGNFYVLGGGTLSEPDYADIVLWWGYYRPGAEVEGTWDGSTGAVGDCSGPDSCATYNYIQPAPTGTPHPVYTAPAATPADGVTSPSAGCGFSFTDPSSWAGAAMCEVARLLRKVIDAVGSILSFLRSIPSWFVPRGAVLRTSFGGVSDAWDSSPVGVVTGAVGDVTSPLTDLEDTSGGCAGPTLNAPLPGERNLTFQPFSACSDLAQLVLGFVMPLETALVYLAGFFVALRILSRTVGLDGPDEAGARA